MIVTDKKILRQMSIPLTHWQSQWDLDDLIQKLCDANNTAWTEGCGLAAIQIGIPLRVAWLNINGKDIILVNPKIIKRYGHKVVLKEGCLSIPNLYTNVERFDVIELIPNSFINKIKSYRSITSRVIQHEIDHMNGVLNIDRKYKPYKIKRRKK